MEVSVIELRLSILKFSGVEGFEGPVPVVAFTVVDFSPVSLPI